MGTSMRAERVAQGRALRRDIPRASHAAWPALANRPQPLDLLERSHEARLPELADLRSRTGSFDIVFEAVGTARVAFAALAVLAPNGVCIFSGVPGEIVLKNQVLFGTVNASRAAFEASVRQLEQFMTLFPVAVRSLITEKVRLDEAPALLRTSGGIKQVVELAA